MNARLYCKTGPLAGSEYQVGEEATIGQREQNDVTLPPDAVSDRHARIYFDDTADCYVLEDLDSRNGTRVDDMEVVDSVPLEDLHIITFAEQVDFIFQAVSEEAASSSAEEEGKTQFGMAPESPSDLADGDEPEGDRTQYGAAARGTLPDFSEGEPSSEEEEGPSEEDDKTRFGESPPELPDFSEEDETEDDRTRFGEAPGTLPDLSGEESSSEEEEGPPEEEDRTQFGESPPGLPDLSEEDELEEDRTRFGEAPGGLPDLPEEESTSEQKEESPSEEEDQTRFGEAPGALPDLPEDEPSSEEEEEETADEVPPSEAPTRAVPGQEFPPAEFSPQYTLQVVLEDGPEDTHTLPQGEVTIGRSADCDVQIEDPGVSREHARLIVEPDKVVVKDMGSKNFTFVNEERLSGPTTLSPGDEIQFGLEVKAVLQRASS